MHRKKSYCLKIQFVKKLNGFFYCRLSVYHRARMVKTIGFFDIKNNFLFLNFSEMFFFMQYGMDIANFSNHNYGSFLKLYSLNNVFVFSMYNWLLSNSNIFFPYVKRYWLSFFKRTLKIVYYCIFKGILNVRLNNINFPFFFSDKRVSAVVNKRLLLIKRLNLI